MRVFFGFVNRQKNSECQTLERGKENPDKRIDKMRWTDGRNPSPGSRWFPIPIVRVDQKIHAEADKKATEGTAPDFDPI